LSELTLEKYLSDGMNAFIRDLIRETVVNPKESVFAAKFSLAAKKAERRRHRYEEMGEHIPSFLIASITGNCNLRCAGCYDQSFHSCAGAAGGKFLAKPKNWAFRRSCWRAGNR
jgi:hypothetical protein